MHSPNQIGHFRQKKFSDAPSARTAASEGLQKTLILACLLVTRGGGCIRSVQWQYNERAHEIACAKACPIMPMCHVINTTSTSRTPRRQQVLYDM
jgi:hypothetical protein